MNNFVSVNRRSNLFGGLDLIFQALNRQKPMSFLMLI
jgi:hypothetical protein